MLEGAICNNPSLSKTNKIKSNTSRPSLQQELGYNDVICGRHRDAGTNIGNRRFRILVAMLTQKYIQAPTRAHKSMVIRDVVDTIHRCGGRFVHQLKGKKGVGSATTWGELLEKQIYDKVGHAFRDISVSIQDKTDINNLLHPTQHLLSDSESIQQVNDSSFANIFDIISIPSSHLPLSQDESVQGEQQDTFDDLSCSVSNLYDDDEIDYNLEQCTDYDLEQCIVTSAAISLPSSIFGNAINNIFVHTDENFQDEYTDVGNQWRRDSIKSFQCLVL